MSENDPKPPPATARLDATTDDVTVAMSALSWGHDEFAPHWFADALAEARSPHAGGTDEYLHARRREIVFSACCFEAYAYEWVLMKVLSDPLEIDYYFANFDKNGKVIRENRSLDLRTEQALDRLFEKGKTTIKPDLGGTGSPHATDWQKLIRFRNGLIHANSSRPDLAKQHEKKPPEPSRDDLLSTPPGWAVRVVIERIKRLHTATGTPPPDWLVEP